MRNESFLHVFSVPELATRTLTLGKVLHMAPRIRPVMTTTVPLSTPCPIVEYVSCEK